MLSSEVELQSSLRCCGEGAEWLWPELDLMKNRFSSSTHFLLLFSWAVSSLCHVKRSSSTLSSPPCCCSAPAAFSVSSCSFACPALFAISVPFGLSSGFLCPFHIKINIPCAVFLFNSDLSKVAPPLIHKHHYSPSLPLTTC